MNKNRCAWAGNDALYQSYHDTEWGVPLHDDRRLFEFLVLESFSLAFSATTEAQTDYTFYDRFFDRDLFLEGAQAGLSWITILRKRDNYRSAFDGFDAARIAAYDANKIESLLQNPGIVRNRLKIEATVINARRFREVQERYGSFDTFVWQFVGGKPRQNHWRGLAEVPSSTPESDAMSKELKRRGFKFVGTTICYAHMQATGMVNDHTTDCFRHRELAE